MLIFFNQEKFIKVVKFICVVILLATILFYILPKLISHLLWIDPHDNNIHFDNYQAPLRVDNILSLQYFNFKI